MAELAKKLHFLKDGTEQTAKAYSAVDEVWGKYVYSTIDNVDCFVPICAIDDALATKGRAIKTLYVKKVMVDEPWQQPVLSANGTMGGSEFACSVSAYKLTSTGTVADAYGAFDSVPSTYWRSGTASGWIQFYNPTPLKVSTLRWGYFYSYPTGGDVQGSNDGSIWDTLTTWTNSSASDFEIPVNSPNAYNYYRVNISGVNTDVIHLTQLGITATYSSEKEIFVSPNETYDYVITDIYAIKSEIKVPYTKITYNTPGTYTFTAPVGVDNVTVTLVGGGGGGALAQEYDGHSSNRGSAIGGNGEDSSFGDLAVATGGGGGSCIYTSSSSACTKTAGSAGYPDGNAGTTAGDNGRAVGGAGFTVDGITYGTGGESYGGGANTSRWWDQEASGGSGGYLKTSVAVASQETYSVIVGAGGKGDKKNSEGASYAHDGLQGVVVIEYGE